MPMIDCATLATRNSMPDLNRELAHWRLSYPEAPCFKSGLQFDRYVATFKFGYDTFLRGHAPATAESQTKLCHRYKDGVAASDRIDWSEARTIVSAIWARLDVPPVLTLS